MSPRKLQLPFDCTFHEYVDTLYSFLQAQSTCEDSNSMSENDDDMSNNDSILNAVKTEPSDILNEPVDSVHRNSNHHVIPAALLSLQGDYIYVCVCAICFELCIV